MNFDDAIRKSLASAPSLANDADSPDAVLEVVYELARSLGRILFGDENSFHVKAEERNRYLKEVDLVISVHSNIHSWSPFTFVIEKPGYVRYRQPDSENKWITVKNSDLEASLTGALADDRMIRALHYAAQLPHHGKVSSQLQLDAMIEQASRYQTEAKALRAEVEGLRASLRAAMGVITPEGTSKEDDDD